MADETPGGVVTVYPPGFGAYLLDGNVGSKIYTRFTSPTGVLGVEYGVAAPNTAKSLRKMEYWNGSYWAHLPSTFGNDGMPDPASYPPGAYPELRYLAGPGYAQEHFVPPPDWAQCEVGGTSGYWIRAVILEALDLATVLMAPDFCNPLSQNLHEFNNARIIEFPFGQFLVYTASSIDTALNRSIIGVAVPPPPSFPGLPAGFPLGVKRTLNFQGEVTTFAAVPAFREIYAAGTYNTAVFKFAGGIWTAGEAAIEQSEALVGTRGVYASVARLPDFPRGEFIEYFKERLWVVARDGEIRWSLGGLGYLVFPQIATTRIMEDDDSPVTGIAGFGEQLVIFKRNSIWIMVDAGIDAFGVTQFSAVKVTSGAGCAAHKTIQKIRGNLMFLGADGIYTFDGTPLVRKVTVDHQTGADRLADVVARIAPGREFRACAVDWKEMACYLLSIPVDGSSANNLVVVYDYERDALWLWDIDVDAWFALQDNKDTTTIFFASPGPTISRLHNTGQDHYADVLATLTTQPIGYVDPSRKIIRSVEVMASSRCDSINLNIDVDEDSAIQVGAIDFSGPLDNGKAVQRTHNVRVRALGSSFKVTLSSSTDQTEQFDVKYLDVGILPQGRR
jgi:hypothetical protein